MILREFELGALDYTVNAYLNRETATALVIFQRPGSNALATAAAVKAQMELAKKDFPSGLDYSIVYNPTEFIQQSVDEVVYTLYEATGLVVIVAARVLRESGATAAQTKVGIKLALGKPKPAIADELGIQLSSVADHTKMLYQDSRCSQFRRASHKNMAEPKTRRGAPRSVARRMSFSGTVLKNGDRTFQKSRARATVAIDAK